MEQLTALTERYRVLKTLEGDGAGTLLYVQDRLREEDLAARVVSESKALDDRTRQDFSQLMRIDHPSVARTFDFGQTETTAYYTRELSDDTSLIEALQTSAGERQLFAYLSAVASALEGLHEAGCVHGLMLSRFIRTGVSSDQFSGVRLVDAGLRRLLSEDFLGSLRAYDPPEVRAGAETSPASDIYQLGATFIEAVGGSEALAGLGRASKRSLSSRTLGVDRHLVELLQSLVAPDPRHRPLNGKELVQMLRASDWVLPERVRSVESLTSPVLVGREREVGHLSGILERAAEGSTHAVEIVGQHGMGRSRFLDEFGVKGRESGWTVVDITSVGSADSVTDFVASIRKAIGTPDAEKVTHTAAGAGLSVAESCEESQRFTAGARAICEAVEKAGARLLLLADNAERWPHELSTMLKYLVTEAGTLPILVAAAGIQGAGLPGAETVAIVALDDRGLRRFIAPLLAESLNPEETFSALRNESGGNPLWIRLVLGAWVQSGQLRFVHGRPFFDEKVRTEAPRTIMETISTLVPKLPTAERNLVDVMAVWGAPLPERFAERLLSERLHIPESLVLRDGESLRFVGDAIGPAALSLLPEERRRHWHACIFDALGGELDRKQKAIHLLGAGRRAEGIRHLVREAREAETRAAYRTAFESLRLAHEYSSGLKRSGGVDRVRVTLDGARLALLVGELHWARAALETISADLRVDSEKTRLEFLLIRANVLRELRHASEAAPLYAEARSLASHAPELAARLSEITLEEAANDAARGDAETGLQRIQPIVERLRGGGVTPLLGLALKRMATLHAHLGKTREAAGCDLRCERIARQLDDPQLAARALVSLGDLYYRLKRPRRALAALDRARANLLRCPHDGLAASELLHRAEILLSLGRTEEVESALLRARALRERAGHRGRLPSVLTDLGRFYRHRGRLVEAAKFYREAIALAEEFELSTAHVARADLGELFLHQGEYEEAERLLRLALADPRPDHCGITLVNLGRLHRERGNYPAAHRALEQAEALLVHSRPGLRPHAVIEASRVLLESGDLASASSRLAAVSDDVKQSREQLAEFQLVKGLIEIAQSEAAEETFDAAVSAAKETGDPTLLGEILISALDRVLASPNPNRAWVTQNLHTLREAAARTDARPVVMGLRSMQGAAAERFPTSSAGDDLASAFLRKTAEGRTPFDLALGEMVQDIEGAAGAMVLIVGLAPDGKPIATRLPKHSPAPGVRPYRVAAREFERRTFREALEASGGNALEAARLLRLPTSTFRYRAEKLKLIKPVKRDAKSTKN